MPRFKVVIEVEYDDRLDAEKLAQGLDRKVDRAIDMGEMLDVKVDNQIYACEQYSMEVSRVLCADCGRSDASLAAHKSGVTLCEACYEKASETAPPRYDELRSLEEEFERAGGRGVELAERIDELRRELGEVSQEPTVERPQEVIVCYDNETWDTHVIRAVSGQAAVDLVYDQIHNGEWSRNPAPVHVGIHREDLEEEEDEDEDE